MHAQGVKKNHYHEMVAIDEKLVSVQWCKKMI